jgi:hypothetical protein
MWHESLTTPSPDSQRIDPGLPINPTNLIRREVRPIRQHHDPRVPLCLFQLIELPTLRSHRRERLGSRLGRVDEKRATEAVGQLRVVVRVVPAMARS